MIGTARITGTVFAAIMALAMSTGGALADRAAGLVGNDLKVELSEWSMGFDEIRAPSGRINVEFFNVGRAPHDFSVRMAGSGELVYRSRVILGGDWGRATLDLAPGEYEIICALPGHANRGMVASLTIGQ
ncbi:MAG: hypothetical protein GXP01_01110 [Alphaproteobacteria bacterium]|nr:hypothetical protein [Alphaproteobacteria bacterium]